MAQYQIPGGSYVDETANDDYQIPGDVYIDETSGSTGTINKYRTLIGVGS